MKRGIVIAVSLFALITLTACSMTANAASQEKKDAEAFVYVHDWSEPKEPNGMVRIKQEMNEKIARTTEATQEAAVESVADSQFEYWDGTAYSGPYDESLNNNPEYLNHGYWDSADGFYSQGVRPGVGSETETYYSSQVRYHERTGEWHTDDEGYWRDADNRYVVSSDDYSQDAIVQTSKGEGRVYDSGSGEGNIDMYVSW